MAEIPHVPENPSLGEGREGVDTQALALALAVSARVKNALGTGHEDSARVVDVEKASRDVDDHFVAQVAGAREPGPDRAPESEAQVTPALKRAAVDAIGDLVPNAKEIVGTLAQRADGAAYLVWIGKNGDDAMAALKDLPGNADVAAIVAALDRVGAGGKAKDTKADRQDAINSQKKEAKDVLADAGKTRTETKESADTAKTDVILKRLETLNPSFAQRANTEYERYAAEQQAKSAERDARGEPAAELLDRRAYLAGAYVAAMSAGGFLGGVAESDRAEASALVAGLHDANREGVARFLREVAPGANRAMLANAVAAHAKAAGVDVDTDGAEPAGDRMDNGTRVKLAKKGDTTVESWPDGKTVYRATDGRRVEADDGTITSYAPDGRRISRTNEGNPSICYLGDIALPLSIAGKSPDDIIHAADAVAQWEGFFKRSGLGFLTAADWQAIERAATVAGTGRTGALAFADSHVPLERDEIEDVAADVEKLAGFTKGDLFDRRGGFALKMIPGHPYADSATVLRTRFRDGWTDGEGVRHEGVLAGGAPDLTRMVALLRDDGTAEEKEKNTMEKTGRTDRPNH